MADDVGERDCVWTAAMEIFGRNNGCGADEAQKKAQIKTLRCTCRVPPWLQEDTDTPPLCALHQLPDDDGGGAEPGTEGRHWPCPRKGSWVTEVIVPRPQVHGGAAFAEYARWRRAVKMPTRFFRESYYNAEQERICNASAGIKQPLQTPGQPT